jgi:hypothetical protein
MAATFCLLSARLFCYFNLDLNHLANDFAITRAPSATPRLTAVGQTILIILPIALFSRRSVQAATVFGVDRKYSPIARIG